MDAEQKGHEGELRAKRALERRLAEELSLWHRLFGRAMGVVFHDLLLPFEKGTTQVDLVAVSTKGLFVIEVKNIDGGICGKPEDEQWTVCYGQKRKSMQNPLKQNARHAEAIRQVCGEAPVQPLVWLVGSATSKHPLGPNVFLGNPGPRVSRGRNIFTEDEVWELVVKINHARLDPTKENKEAHIAQCKRWNARRYQRSLFGKP